MRCGRLQGCFYTFFALLFVVLSTDPAFAQDVSNVATNVVKSTEKLPGLISALSYLLGLIFGVTGIFKLKNHVENPGNSSGQTPLRTPLIYLFVGGAFFSLPIVYEALFSSISGGSDSDLTFGNVFQVFTGSSTEAGADNKNMNTVLSNIVYSIRKVPGFVSAIAYLFGLVLGVTGLLKLKDHVETPEQTKLHEVVARFLAAGALFALPTIFTAMYETIDGNSDLVTSITGAITSLTTGAFLESNYGNGDSISCGTFASAEEMNTSTLGQSVCGIVLNSGLFPAFLTAIAYLFGTVLGFWGIFKLRDHVLNPAQTDVFQGISRLIAGGAFFALPAVVAVFQNTLSNTGDSLAGTTAVSGFDDEGGIVASIVSIINAGGANAGCPSGLGLDGMFVCFAADLLGPVHITLTFFAYIAGIILIMIGVSRLLKSAQEGARAPGGIGTIMTFLMGGALLSYNELIRAATSTLTGSSESATNGILDESITSAMSGDEKNATHAVIASIVKFMIIIGLISFVRGLFIMRNVAEGNQQASMMAAVTHIIGGALAINIGPVINAVQNTLGITGYGITFS